MEAAALLLWGGIGSILIAVLHVILLAKPSLYNYFGADELADMHAEGNKFTGLVTAGLVGIFALWGMYGLAGAEKIDPLPWMRPVLIAIGVIYLLRALLLPGELFKVIFKGESIKFVFFSLISLAMGLLYLFGTL